MYVRWFLSAVDPADVDEVRRLFEEDVRPAFKGIDGCSSIELVVNTEVNAGGLVEGAALSRWESLEALERALSLREVTESMVRILALLRLEPVSKTFEVVG
jgi:quinol monooxygenase YgiN